MRRSILIVGMAMMIPVFLSACSKKEEPPPPPPPAQMMPGAGMSGAPHGEVTMPPAESMTIQIPESIRAKWKGVTLTVVDRETSGIKDFTTPLGQKLSIPQSSIVVQVTDFVPDFKIEGSAYTSGSPNPVNPAVNVIITEGGKEIFRGWLFQKFPSIHTFKHNRFGITLKEGVPS